MSMLRYFLAFSFLTTTAMLHAGQDESAQFIVKFKQAKNAPYLLNQESARLQAKALLQRAGGQIKRELIPQNAIAVTLPASAVAALRKDLSVAYIEPDHKRYILSAKGQEIPYGISMVQADLVGDEQAANRKVCVIDTGYNLGHEDLTQDLVTGVNDPGTGNWFHDGHGHGTHVSGTIAAINNSRGVVGVLPSGKVNLHIIKVFDDEGHWAFSSSLIHAVNLCVDAGSNVINMSLGGDFYSETENQAFQQTLDKGVLSVAAAGNDGDGSYSYPASYPSVISVAAIDANKQKATFSQYNDHVELAAPGVGVLSTVPMNNATISELQVNHVLYPSAAMNGSPYLQASANLADCGYGNALCPEAKGKVCLIKRGQLSFSDKVLNCQASGGVGALIYNNVSGIFLGTLGGVMTSIPSASLSDVDGLALKEQLNSVANLAIVRGHYNRLNGTSMASPHVAGVAALVWSHHPQCNAKQIRDALAKTAQDLGTPGRDVEYGYGLVQALSAKEYLDQYGCAP